MTLTVNLVLFIYLFKDEGFNCNYLGLLQILRNCVEQHLLQRERKGCENKTSNKNTYMLLKCKRLNPSVRKLHLECEIQVVSPLQ